MRRTRQEDWEKSSLNEEQGSNVKKGTRKKNIRRNGEINRRMATYKLYQEMTQST